MDVRQVIGKSLSRAWWRTINEARGRIEAIATGEAAPEPFYGAEQLMSVEAHAEEP